MLLSVSLILLLGMFLGFLCKKAHLPALCGMLLTGVLLGPAVFDLIDPSILNISADIRKIALVVILTRAGLSLDLTDLKKIGRPALLMCAVPATAELIGCLIFAPILFGLTLTEAAILGAVLAAVSPAVVVPRMIHLMETGYGTGKGIPQLILAGASVDDVYVIVLFTTFMGMAQGNKVSVMSFVNIPISVVLGILAGLLLGTCFGIFFEKLHIRDTAKMMILLSASLLLCVAENALTTPITFSSLIAVMFIGYGLKRRRAEVAERLSLRFNKVWVGAEIFLFVLVGASVNISYLGKVGFTAVALIILALLFRMLGVFLCMLGTPFSGKERLFCMLAYTPKATVQAAIGGLPLAAGLACGEAVLTIAVLAIVLTAPLGAFAIDFTYHRLLGKNTK